MKLFDRNKEITDGGSISSAGPLKRIAGIFTGGMTAAEKTTSLICAVVCAAAVIWCFAVTLSAVYTLCLLGAALLFFMLLRLICMIAEKCPSYKAKTWAVYLVLLAAASCFMFTLYTYDYDADTINLLTGAKTINTYDDAVTAAKNKYTNTVIEINKDSFIHTDYSYAIQRYKGGTLLDSETLYNYYLCVFDGKYVLCRADKDYLDKYFDEKEKSGDRLTRIYASTFGFADGGTYDSIYSPTLEIYPYDGDFVPYEERIKEAEKEAEEIDAGTYVEEDTDDDYFTRKHKTYLKYYSDLPLYELNGDFVFTIKDYDIDMQKTILLGMIAFAFLTLNALFCVLFHPAEKTAVESSPEKRIYKKKRKK